MHAHGGSEISKGEGWVGGWVGEGLLHAWVWARVCCMHGYGQGFASCTGMGGRLQKGARLND